MDWFVEVAEAQNVSKAARTLHLSQPTVSRMLGRLEHQLGTSLFDRVGRRLILNERGQVYLDHCRRARAEMDAARSAVAELLDPVRGTVRLAFLHSFGTRLVPELIGEFRRTVPVSFTLHQDAAEIVVARVESGDSDLGIVSPRPVSTAVAWSRMSSQRLGLAVPADHRLAGRVQATLGDVASEPFVAMSPGFGLRRILEELTAAADFRPRITFESSELGTIAGLVGAGLGVALIPLDDSPPPHETVSVIPLADAGGTREIGMIWRRDRPLGGAAARFRDFVVERRRQPASRRWSDRFSADSDKRP